MVKEKFINDFEKSYEYEKEVQTEITELPPYYIAAMPDAVQEEIKAKVIAALTEYGECTPENVERAMSSKIYDLDDLIDIKEYVRQTVPKTIWSNDYLQELWDEKNKYLKGVRESNNGYGFDDIGAGAAYAYSTMYQKIVEGYSNETRKVYTCDDSESGKRRLLTMDEELEKLNKGFEELIKWDQMVAKSQKQNAENRQKFQNVKLDESFDTFDINQVCDYIQDSYLEFRS